MNNHVNASGYLEVGDSHTIYWEDWGNPLAQPIFHLHGGPGGGFNDSHKSIYNPAIHRVIFHDQRGCGKSLPFAETKNNTTQQLIEDIERLREHLNIERFHLAGGSWGSTLALLYAITHPERVMSLMIWSIFLARKSEIDYVHGGQPRNNFPEAWERFISLVPSSEQSSSEAILNYYWKMINSKNPKIAQQYADEWTLWELSLVSLDYNQNQLMRETIGEPDNLAVAKLEIHFFLNSCFIPENYILANIQQIQQIPCQIIHGRFDMCTPPSSAYELWRAYGAKAALQWVNSGHLRTEPTMLEALQHSARSLV